MIVYLHENLQALECAKGITFVQTIGSNYGSLNHEQWLLAGECKSCRKQGLQAGEYNSCKCKSSKHGTETCTIKKYQIGFVSISLHVFALDVEVAATRLKEDFIVEWGGLM